MVNSLKKMILNHFYAFINNNFIVEINLNVFAGDATLEFIKDIINKYKYDYVFFDSSEKYIFIDKNVKGHKIKLR